MARKGRSRVVSSTACAARPTTRGMIKNARPYRHEISGIISDLGMSWRYGRAFFIIPRVVGLAAHAVEETTREHPFRAIDFSDVAYDGPAERDLPASFPPGG